MKLRLKSLLGCLLAVSLFACEQAPRRQDADQKEEWLMKMRQLSTSLNTLLPLVISKREFDNPNNFAKIEKETKTLAGLSHEVKISKVKPDGDPGMEFISRKFSEDMSEATRQLSLGNRSYARFIIRNTSTFCITCHTRNDQGRQNLDISLTSANLSSFSPLERAQYHMAIREFDRGLEDFDKAANSPDAFLDANALENTAEKALAVAVRVKRDPGLANEFVSRILDSKWAPIYLRLNAREWKKSIKDWTADEKKTSEKAKKAMKPEAQLAQAKALMAKGWKHTAISPQSRAGLVDYLRASSVLHDVLGLGNTTAVYGESLYYAGLSAEALREINLWTLHEAYYEACIRHQPYSNLAKKCYLRLEALVLSSYSGADGGYVPAHVRERLLELKALAEKNEGDFLEWGFVE